MLWKKDKREVKPLGRQVSWQEWKDSPLPSAVDSHMISVLTDTKEYRTIVGDGVVDFDIVVTEEKVYMVIHNGAHEKNLADIKHCQLFTLCMSDDPAMEHANDWTQMGCMRIFYVMEDATVELHKDFILVECPRAKFKISDSYNEISVDKVK